MDTLPAFTSSAPGNLGSEATEPSENLLKQRNTFVIRKRAASQKPGAGAVVWPRRGTARNQVGHFHLWSTRPLSRPHSCHPAVPLSLLLGAHHGVPKMAYPSRLVLVEAGGHLSAMPKSPEKEPGAVPGP